NVKHGALAFGTDPHQVESITRSIRKITPKPLIIKLTPNVTDITSIAKAAENGGADAVSCINTLVGMVIDTKQKKPVLPGNTGGLSGPAIRPVGVAMAWKTARAVAIPVIGIGGIAGFDDALQYFLAGASAIQIGTGMFIDPQTPAKILHDLETFCSEEAIHSIPEITRLCGRNRSM
ncbi:MAG: dihydroorotate dehydrogenase, partial [Chitinivibrionales bacterium]|nr:dihydroorotate dehydrogenase [Chitinivibrionales bacterium]